MEFKSFLDEDEDKTDKKPRNLNFSIGVSSSGFNLEHLRKSVLKQGDLLKFSFNMNERKE